MNLLWLLAPAVSFVLLGAHFFRAGQWPLLLACVVLLPLLLVRRAWVPRLMQACLLAGSLEWVWTAFALAQQRIAFGQPWLRLASILGVVAMFTAASALVFGVRRLRVRWAVTADPGFARPGTDAFRLPRLHTSDRVLALFAARASGLTSVARRGYLA